MLSILSIIVSTRFLATDYNTGTIFSLNYTLQVTHIKSSLHSRTRASNTFLQSLPHRTPLDWLSKKSKSHCDWRSVSQWVSLHDQIFIAVWQLRSCFFVGRPLWREDGSIFCGTLTEQSQLSSRQLLGTGHAENSPYIVVEACLPRRCIAMVAARDVFTKPLLRNGRWLQNRRLATGL
jgi:hypothetical protein